MWISTALRMHAQPRSTPWTWAKTSQGWAKGQAEPTHPHCICAQSQGKVEQGSSKPSESLADGRLLTIPTS